MENKIQPGVIYLVGTPIGNLEDITFRAVRILKEADLIAAEDTRHTRKLLNHYAISTPLTSYHEHNERTKAVELVTETLNGKKLAVVSNAGMPGISDPGYRIVREAIKQGVRVEVVPGPTAVESALAVSGLPTDSFVFEGFLPQKKTARKKRLFQLIFEERTMVFYESARRLKDCLEDIMDILGNRQASFVKEITKIHENVFRGKVRELISFFKDEEPKGEFVVLVSGTSGLNDDEKPSPDELIKTILEKMDISRMEAIKLAAYILGLSKSMVYRQGISKKNL
jgi:16S rRNA (cytidine1402-2'-O)-methyltransferase